MKHINNTLTVYLLFKCRFVAWQRGFPPKFAYCVSVLKLISIRLNRRSGGRIFFSRVDFLCWLLFRYPFHPRVTAEARKRSWSFCQKCRWQVTAKHAHTVTYVALHEVTWCMVVWCTQNLRRDGCSFMWHQLKYTTSVDIKKQNKNKKRYKKLVTHVEPQASAVSLLKRAENSVCE